mgnify:FL=1
MPKRRSTRYKLYAMPYRSRRGKSRRPAGDAPAGIRAVLHRVGAGGCADCGVVFLAQPPRGFRAGRRIAIVRIPSAHCVEQRALRAGESSDAIVVQVRAADGALVDARVPLEPCRL